MDECKYFLIKVTKKIEVISKFYDTAEEAIEKWKSIDIKDIQVCKTIYG